MTITVQDLVNREVHYCVSALVSTLAKHDVQSLDLARDDDLAQLTEQAFELASPIDDWEEAAIQAGWSETKDADGSPMLRHVDLDRDWPLDEACAYEEACRDVGVDKPYQREVYEHWIVSDWLADRLAEKGEKVDKDFAGLTVWARTTTGQGIASDSVIEAIHAELVR